MVASSGPDMVMWTGGLGSVEVEAAGCDLTNYLKLHHFQHG